MLLLSSVLISSCSDDEQMTTDHSAQLSFSQDTVSFDTIFSGITSPTERVRVYNKNDKGLRIKNVRLESGGTSGFMMNVDGQNGTSINDVQVLKKDSVFLFVKVNIPTSSAMKPTKSAGESVVPIWRMSVMVAMADELSALSVFSRIM